MPGTQFPLEVQPTLPARLARLKELADDLLYSWERQVRGLFYRLDPQLWETCGHNPRVFLRRVAQSVLDEAINDRVFIQDYNRVLSAYDIYREERIRSGVEEILDPDQDLVAYFCAEFGFHESFPIYSGGLGILAGDHCKAASDLGVPFVAVGMLYRRGYFNQIIDEQGNQVAQYAQNNVADLPVTPAQDRNGTDVYVEVELPGRTVRLKVWQAVAGHIRLYLLDSDLPENSEADRSITYQLYGGDIHTRMQQEIVLGIGGVRTLRQLGLQPTVWHINEGHAAFQILERCRELIDEGLSFEAALEAVASGTVFTTHTPVPAGHDIFPHEMVDEYLSPLVQRLGISREAFLELGAGPANPHGFNQTALALRGSRFHNGVSRIHGGVASQMEAYVWPQIPAEENPIGYVTNGVHVPTFLAREWANVFDMQFGGGWRTELCHPDYWQRIDDIPDHSFWSLRQSLKAMLLEDVRRRAVRQHRRNGLSESQTERLVQHLRPHETEVLTVGFARRFATYKRATLLFADPERLERLLNDPERPVILIFAGKAHPHDQPGQHLIRIIHDFSRRPEFEGKIILLEGYDLALSRKLVSGVDVWLNNPDYPLEASGTSGQKAGINGVLNLSILDGWWGEGYDGENGWAITPHGPQYDATFRNREEAHELMDILEKQVVPLYYERNGHGYSEGWVRKSKASMRSLMPRFSSERMVMDYVKHYYGPAKQQHAALMADEFRGARVLSEWKKKVRAAWPGVSLGGEQSPPSEMRAGESLVLEVNAQLNGLEPDDVVVECLVGTLGEDGEFVEHDSHAFDHQMTRRDGAALFRLDLQPPLAGLQYYKVRMYPYHAQLSHRFETGCMLWL
ncbi:alpha-glucan family phosphorylase [Ectothiorhodospiraceae bacterium 2226]|nr:alpha-glucan family phosphorylase [Ectothiorhodospiraceae bacterium 2226]